MVKQMKEETVMTLIYRELEGMDAYVESYSGAKQSDQVETAKKLTAAGYSERARYNLGDGEIAVFEKGADIAMLSYYPSAEVLRLVTESNSGYLAYLKGAARDNALRPRIHKTVFTQVDLEDYGISFVIRLPDGRFVIFDGGWEGHSDADRLMETLEKQCLTERPVIAAWIFTHPHIDHYRCYIKFAEKYKGRVDVERFIYNFPDPDPNDARLPRMTHRDEYIHLGRLNALVKESGADYIRAHTGEVFDFSGVKFEILSSPDDVFYTPVREVNDHSLVIKMYAEGQSILIPADAQFCNIDIAARLGEYLKSDILQVPHHFFTGGDIRTYDLIRPEVIIIPSTEELSFSFISLYKENYRKISEHLLYNVGVNECFAGGDGNIVLTLPYKSPEGARERMYARIDECKRSVGATSWYFDGITKETAEFTFINSVWSDNTVHVDLLFEDAADNVADIKFAVPARAFKRLNILTDESVDPDNLISNTISLKKKGGVPEGKEFVVHIKAKYPIVVSGSKPAIYHS